MRPFEANGIALGFCGQCVSRKFVRYDETRPHDLPLRCHRVRVSPGHERVCFPGMISRLTFSETIRKVMLLHFATLVGLSFQFGGFGEEFDWKVPYNSECFYKSYLTDFRKGFYFCNDNVPAHGCPIFNWIHVIDIWFT
jgi:hypothetical protein